MACKSFRFKAEIGQLLDLVCMHFPGTFFVAVADLLQRYLLGDLLVRAYFQLLACSLCPRHWQGAFFRITPNKENKSLSIDTVVRADLAQKYVSFCPLAFISF